MQVIIQKIFFGNSIIHPKEHIKPSRDNARRLSVPGTELPRKRQKRGTEQRGRRGVVKRKSSELTSF
jgi:hypothetical protein